MSDNTKEHVKSAVITLVSVFLTTFGTALATLPESAWTQAGWHTAVFSIAITAVRAALKAGIQSLS